MNKINPAAPPPLVQKHLLPSHPFYPDLGPAANWSPPFSAVPGGQPVPGPAPGPTAVQPVSATTGPVAAASAAPASKPIAHPPAAAASPIVSSNASSAAPAAGAGGKLRELVSVLVLTSPAWLTLFVLRPKRA